MNVFFYKPDYFAKKWQFQYIHNYIIATVFFILIYKNHYYTLILLLLYPQPSRTF